MGSAGPQELGRLGRAFDGMARGSSAPTRPRQFLADVAHEIATPLNTISGFGMALADGTARGEGNARKTATSTESETGRLQTCSPTCESSPAWI